jgi:hypothetical protein
MLDTNREPQDIASADGINPATGVAASQVQRVRRRDELFDDVDEPSDDFGDEPIMFGRASALMAAQKIGLADRSLDAFRSADIGALIDRLGAVALTSAPQTAPAVDVLQRLKRLMDYTERRRNVARPVAGPPVARDGMKRLPPPPRPDFAPSAARSAVNTVAADPRASRVAVTADATSASQSPSQSMPQAERTVSSGHKAERGPRPQKDRPE